MACAEAYTAALEVFCRDPSPYTSFLLQGFSKLVLAPLPRGGRRHQSQAATVIHRRLAQWSAGQYSVLLAGLPVALQVGRHTPRSSSNPSTVSESLRRAVIAAAAEHNPGKGARLLFSNSAPAEDAQAQLQALHPQGSPVEAGPLPADDAVCLTADMVQKSALSFAPGSSAGPSGFRPVYFRELLRCGPTQVQDALLQALTSAVNLLANGKVPSSLAPFFACARLIGLRKDGGGIRPIAVGEVLRRLVGKALLSEQSPFLSSILAPSRCRHPRVA